MANPTSRALEKSSLATALAALKVAIGFERVVRGTPEAEVVGGVRAALRPGLDMRKLKPPSLIAAMAVVADETTAAYLGISVGSSSRGA